MPWHPYWRIFLAAAILLTFPVVRLFWLASGREGWWLDAAAVVLVGALTLLCGRGDRVRRFLVPGILCLVGWPWLLLYAAFRHTPTHPAQAITRAFEWLPRRVLAAIAAPPAVMDQEIWPREKRRRALLLLLLLSTLLHARAFLNARQVDIEGIDGRWYLLAARSILETGEYRAPHPLVDDGGRADTRAARVPGYPLFLAGCHWLGGRHGVRLASALQSAAGAAAVLLVFLLAEALCGSLAGLFAGLLYAGYPPLWHTAPYILTEPFAVPYYLLVALLLRRAYHSGEAWRWGVAGLALGALTLIRPNTILTPLFLLAATAMLARRHPRAVRRSWCLALGFACALAPWWIRNQLLFHTFVPTATLGGHAAWAGNYLPHRGTIRAEANTVATRILREHQNNEVLADRELMRMAFARLRDNARYPLASYRLFANKISLLIGKPARGDDLSVRLHALILGGALVGLACLRRSPASGLLLAFALSVVLLHLATYAGEPRYALPLLPFLIAWAGAGIARIVTATAK